jgi:hypothetical protein
MRGSPDARATFTCGNLATKQIEDAGPQEEHRRPDDHREGVVSHDGTRHHLGPEGVEPAALPQ